MYEIPDHIFTVSQAVESAKPEKEPSGDPDAAWLGEQIRNLRKLKGMSLKSLQEATGRSLGFLSQLERGKSRASVEDLSKITAVLGIPFNLLFYPADGAERGIVMRRESRPRLRYSDGISDFLLSPNLGGNFEMVLTTLEPGAQSGTHSFRDEGFETGFVISGDMDLWVEDKHFSLRTADSFSYEGKMPHRYANMTDTMTQVVWMIQRT